MIEDLGSHTFAAKHKQMMYESKHWETSGVLVGS